MERIAWGYSEGISHALLLLPQAIRDMLRGIDFLTGIDPIYAGLHSYENTCDGRSYRNQAHVVYPYQSSSRQEKTTVVIPVLRAAHPYIVMHELGHCIDEIMGFEHVAKPLNEYAATSREEAFAEAWACQYFWLGEKAEIIFSSDLKTKELFARLAN